MGRNLIATGSPTASDTPKILYANEVEVLVK